MKEKNIIVYIGLHFARCSNCKPKYLIMKEENIRWTVIIFRFLWTCTAASFNGFKSKNCPVFWYVGAFT